MDFLKIPKKTFSLTLFIALLAFQLQAQNATGKVVDSENSEAIEAVKIENAEGSFLINTDQNGEFSLLENNTYTFSKKGYMSRSIYISTTSNSIIELVALPENLSEVIIVSNNFKSKLKTLPTAITVKSAEEIERNNTVNIAPIINTIAGVYMHNGTFTTNRITIRGIGSRNLFGTSKIRAYYQDIPLTNGSGSSTIEDIEISTLGRIEISKGPSSSTYGSGLGGTIQLIPNKGTFDEISANAGSVFGSYGLQKYLVQANYGDKKNSGTITYSNLHSDGYRENNETSRQTFTVATNHLINENNKLIFIGNYIDLKAYIPSSLNEDDYLNDPTKAAFTWGRAMGFEDYTKGLFGLSWQHEYSEKTNQTTSVFTSFLDSYEPRPFNVLQERTHGIGLRSRINSEIKIFGKPLQWTLGGEVFRDANTYQTFENLYEDFPPEVGSVEGSMLSDFREKRKYFNVFSDSQYKVSKTITVSIGMNLNYTSYTLDDSFLGNETDFSGDYNFGAILSPKFGLTHQFGNSTMVYTSVSHGFSPPTLEETLLPDGLINSNIKPESGWNYEIGSRGDLFDNKLHFDISVYRMNVKNLLVARRTANDQFIGVNAGKTTYNGLELALNYQIYETEGLRIYHSNAFSYNDFTFKEFIDNTDDYSGNDLTGVPNHTFNSNLNVETGIGIYALINYNYVGAIPIRDDNTLYSDKYQVITTKLGFRSNNSKKLQLDIYGCVNNLFDEKYAAMLLINAGSFGGNAPRYYYPGEPVNYYAGANLKYLF